MGYDSAYIGGLFKQARPRLLRLCGRLVDDAQAVVDEAAAFFEEMTPHLPYVNNPRHPLASASFTTSINLAAFVAARSRGIDAHTFGAAMVRGVTRAPIPVERLPEDPEELNRMAQAYAQAGEASQAAGHPGRDVFEWVTPEEGSVFGYNITRCSIRIIAARYDADQLVPYFCAVDDVMSEKGDQGLRRTGSLALGAACCDFRFQPGTPGHSLADQYPQQIKV